MTNGPIKRHPSHTALYPKTQQRAGWKGVRKPRKVTSIPKATKKQTSTNPISRATDTQAKKRIARHEAIARKRGTYRSDI